MCDKDLNLATLAAIFADETQAREFLEAKRWPDGPVCPFCQSQGVYKLTPKPGSTSPVRAGVYKCKACRKQFTVRVGTIFEDSHIPLAKWLMAIHLMTSSKKGISSHQLGRELGITLKSAWFLSHRVREAMRQEPIVGLLSGVVEVDETYVEGKPRPQNKPDQWAPPQTKQGRATDKQAVIVLVERNGSARAMPIDRVDGNTLKSAVREHVSPESTIMSDEWHGYQGLNTEFLGGHFTVTHSHKEYVRYVNTSMMAPILLLPIPQNPISRCSSAGTMGFIISSRRSTCTVTAMSLPSAGITEKSRMASAWSPRCVVLKGSG